VNDEFEAFAEANGITLKVITKMNLDMIKEQGCRVSFMSNGFDGGRCLILISRNQMVDTSNCC
jgi:hypothetical protein